MLLLVSLLIGLGLVACKQLSALEQGGDRFVADSQLVFEPDHIDFGSVKEGEHAIGYLRVRNAGNTIANIVAVETSCGCSVAEPEQQLLMPGGFTRIRVDVDTFAKQGDAKKWVELTDGAGHHSRAWLTLHVEPNPHLKTNSRSIFKGKCAACHFDPAIGKTGGAEIYRAVCAMCHGGDRAGVSGPSLQQIHDIDLLRSIISEGAGSHHMPGFARKNGGPLSPDQIEALSRWLVTLDE